MRWTGWLMVFLLAAGCARSRAPQRLPDSTMVQLLVEMHLLTARMETRGDVPPSARDSLFAAYGTDSLAFYTHLRYLSEHPEEGAALYGRVLDILREELARLDTL